MATETHNPEIAATDYFQIFGLPRKLNLDEAVLQRDFYRLSRESHPDRFARASASEQQHALDRSSQLNDAYRLLRDPVTRTRYLLELEGVQLEEQSSAATQAARASGTEKKQVVPPELLEEVFELNMQLQELRANKEKGEDDLNIIRDLQAAKSKFESRMNGLMDELRGLWNQWDEVIATSSSTQQQRESVRDKMVELLNRRSYIRNLVRDVNQALQD